MNLNNALKIILKQEISCANENINLEDALGRTLSRSITIKKIFLLLIPQLWMDMHLSNPH